MNKERRDRAVTAFDPDNSLLTNAGIFGLPFSKEESEVVLLPLPWEVTVSFRPGTALGPNFIFDASSQIDLYDYQFGEVWKRGLYYEDRFLTNDKIESDRLRKLAEEHIRQLESGLEANVSQLNLINEACLQFKETVKNRCLQLLNEGHVVGLIGGDHSTPVGYLEALGEKHKSFGILQIDAHCDLRDAYEGFTYSHASIFHNALAHNPNLTLVQAGIRDLSKAEMQVIESSENIKTFFDHDIQKSLFKGGTWDSIAKEIVAALPEKVYISFDIDGLDPSLCPTTGTPVPGGFSFEQIAHLLGVIKDSGKQIIGFDLSETGPTQWDAIVAGRILYKLCALLHTC